MPAPVDDNVCIASLAKDKKKIPISEAVKAKREKARKEKHRRTVDEHGRCMRWVQLDECELVRKVVCGYIVEDEDPIQSGQCDKRCWLCVLGGLACDSSNITI